MSIWTHVTGAVRIDHIPGLGPMAPPTIEERFGRCVDYEDDDYSTTVPCGSEGSLHWNLNVYQDGLPWGIVTVWGDLRDYENPEAIFRWLKKAVAGLIVRDCAVQIHVERRETWIVVDDPDIPLTEGSLTMLELPNRVPIASKEGAGE